MFCEECGSKIEDGLAFCTNCGTKIPQNSAPDEPSALQFPEWTVTEDSIVYRNEVIDFANITYLNLGSESLYLLTAQRNYELPFSPEDQERAAAAHAYILNHLSSAKAAVIADGVARVHESFKATTKNREEIPVESENILIHSPAFSAKEFFTHMLKIGAVLSIGIFLLMLIAGDGVLGIVLSLLFFVVFALICGLLALWLRCYRLTVTDKRVYGTGPFGKLVSLPIDSITAVAMLRFLSCVSVSTPTGRITFYGVRNAWDIYRVINNLLIIRQQ